jgi:hypothetical protein
VETAEREIRVRGEQPVVTIGALTDSERARPASDFDAVTAELDPPDPQGRINRDEQGLIGSEVTVVPPQLTPGGAARVHIMLRPNAQLKAHWNNEAEPLRLWVDAPPGWRIQPQLLTAPQGDRPETTEARGLEFEARAPANSFGAARLNAYALYYVCEDAGGACFYLRQDIPIRVAVKK